MTDELNPQFQIFSDMLDNEESLGESSISLMGEDGSLLLQLRQQLRGEAAAPSLPDDFAKTTATAVEQRFDELPLLTRGLLSWEPVLRARPFSKAGLPWLFAASLLGLGAATVSWTAVGLLGLLLLLPGLAVKSLYQQRLAQSMELPDAFQENNPMLNRLFYLLPTLAVLLSSGLAGKALGALGTVSLSFQANSNNLQLAALAGVLVVFTWLYNALWPLWRAYEEATRGRTLRTLFVQGLYGLWLLVCALAYLEIAGENRAFFRNMEWPEYLMLGLLALPVAITAVLSRRHRGGPRHYPLIPAYKRCIAGFLAGAVPIALVFVVFYQASLTREITTKPQYEEMTRSVEEWLAKQAAILPQDNGMTDLSPILFARDGVPKEGAETARRLQLGADLLYADEASEELSQERRAEREKAKREFLQELPRIEAAIAKPHFSYLTQGQLNMQTRLPNFIICRAIGQGLQAMVQDSLAAEDHAKALEYQRLNLKWTNELDQGLLIDLMVSLSLKRIALASVETMVFDRRLSDQQLRDLLAEIGAAQPDRLAFRDAMFRETYAADRTFQGMAEGVSMFPEQSLLDRESAIGRFIPKSYWESERKVYLTLQLSQTANWTELGEPSTNDLQRMVELLPWSIAGEIVPNLARAQIQFMASLSRFSALRLEIALELYKREHGAYPANLETLVPRYIDAVPVDAMHPNLWKRKGGFGYRPDGESYRLVSESPLYEQVRMEKTQSYGPDGKYEFE